VAEGNLKVPAVPPGEVVSIDFPEALTAATATEPKDERWLTITAALGADEPWAGAGHEIAFAQSKIGEPEAVAGNGFAAEPARPSARQPLAGPSAAGWPATEGNGKGQLELGCAVLDPGSGELRRLGRLPVRAVFPDFWRAPVDNDVVMAFGDPVADSWREAGLNRLGRETVAVSVGDGWLSTELRIAPAGQDFALLAGLTWAADPQQAGTCLLTVRLRPEGDWPCPLPKMGLRVVFDAWVDSVSWFGRGPGEAYRDTHRATRVGRFGATVEALSTPYVRPQENGNRMHTRNLQLFDSTGLALSVGGQPPFDFAVRRWSPELIAAARHTPDLLPDGRTYLHLDIAHHGIGSGSCGPGVLPGDSLMAHGVGYVLRFST
jgi:beta-galactosidase